MEPYVSYVLWLWLSIEDVDQELLLQALTHKSFSADTPDEDIPHNERLEFLWDSLLGARVAEDLFTLYPGIPESKLTLAKIYLVKEWTLADVARQIELGTYIRLGNWERRSGGDEKDAVLSDTLEALIAYLYLVHGREAIASFIKKYIMSQLKDLTQLPWKSWKSILQEFVQKRYKQVPVYIDVEDEVEASGNVLRFLTHVQVNWKHIASWTWQSKKKAQEVAAEKALVALDV